MKKDIILILALALGVIVGCSQNETEAAGDGTATSLFEGTVNFDSIFTGEQLRIDFILAGDASRTDAYVDKMFREPQWAGSPNSLIDPFRYGQYFFEAFSGEDLVFSHGFSTLFEEWQSTAQAANTPMAMRQSFWMPCPKDSVHCVLYHRVHKTGRFVQILEFDVDPADRHIIPVEYAAGKRVETLVENGDVAHKVDLLFLAEGYAEDEMEKFRKDVTCVVDYFFSMEPYASRRDDFNVRLAYNISPDSGTDIPHQGQWRETAMDSSFDTFYVDRYLTIQDHGKIADAALGVPFDALLVLANEEKYGGGGIYNSYAMGTSDNHYSLEVMIHEFGHSFAGLGDEYFNSEVAYEDFYELSIEPWEANITTLVDFDSKWKDMLEEGTPIPTPVDSTTTFGQVGVYEGGGYMSEGVYRPSDVCRMRNNTAPGFCPVCCRAIGRMIDYYVK